jgi:CheY-like chemotaxis protein
MAISIPVPMVNKRFALIGLSDHDESMISESLNQVRARAVRISGDAPLVGVNVLAPFDGCIVNLAAFVEERAIGGVTLADLQRREVLALVDEAQLSSGELASMLPEWEVIVRPLQGPELLMRLSRLIVKVEQKNLPQTDDAVRKVLIVDDDQTVRSLLSAILESAGFKCDCAPNAGEALAALARRRHELVMLDLAMPEIDGFKVLKSIRSGHQARNPAVIIVSSEKREEEVLRGFGLGADDYVLKPFKPRELVARCQRALRDRERADADMRFVEQPSRNFTARVQEITRFQSV